MIKKMYTNKKFFLIIINSIWIISTYIIFKNRILEQQQIYRYVWFRSIWINLLFLQRNIAKFLSIPFLMGTIWLLIIGNIPLYKNNPNENLFYTTQQMEIFFSGNPTNVEIKEKSENTSQKIQPKEPYQKLLFKETSSRTVSLEEIIDNPKEKNRLLFHFPDNSLYILLPGSEILRQRAGNNYTIKKFKGKSEYYQPSTKITNIETDNFDQKKEKSTIDFWYLLQNYEEAQKKYIINQGGGQIIMQPFYQKFSKKVLELCFSLRPNIYKTNIENYNSYKELLERKDIPKPTYENDNFLRKSLYNQVEKGLEQTNVVKKN